MKLTKEEIAVLEECAQDRSLAKETFLRVYDKQGKLVPLKTFPHHAKYHKYAKPFSIIIKARQVYVTTDIEGDTYYECNISTGVKAVFLNLDGKKTEMVFDRAKKFHEYYPEKIRQDLKKDTGMAMCFKDNGSEFHALTCKNDAGQKASKEFGRSITAQIVHISEAPYMIYLKEILDGLMGAVPEGEIVRVILEGTGNGAQGECYDRAMVIKDNGEHPKDENGEDVPNVWHYGEQSLHFIAWFEHYEYRMDKDPFETLVLDERSRKMWIEDEQDHVREMEKYGDIDIQRALNWRRSRAFNKFGLVKDPAGCIKIMNQEYPATLKHAFQSSGTAFLSMTKTDQQHTKWKEYNRTSKFAPLPWDGSIYHEKGEKPIFKQSLNGEIMVWIPPEIGWSSRYCLGADVGGGLADSDRDCVFVKDRLTNQYVACVHGTYGPKKLAKLMLDLATYYCRAKIGWENNNHGIGVTQWLLAWDYPHLYSHKDEPRRDAELDWGFYTGVNSRSIGLELLKARYEDQVRCLEIPYLGFYPEARAFQTPPGKTKPKGIGEHDDCIMAAMITEAVCKSMPPCVKMVKKTEYHKGTIGYVKQKALGQLHNKSRALRNM